MSEQAVVEQAMLADCCTSGMDAMPFQATFQPLIFTALPEPPVNVIGEVVWCIPVPPKKVHGASMFGLSLPVTLPV